MPVLEPRFRAIAPLQRVACYAGVGTLRTTVKEESIATEAQTTGGRYILKRRMKKGNQK